MHRRQLTGWVLILGLVSVAGMALAHTGAMGVVKERMDAMSEFGDHMKIVSEMLRGRREIDAEQIVSSGRLINQHASNIGTLFPEGSTDGPSEAAERIWSEWDDFIALAEDLRQASAELIEIAPAVNSATDLKPTFNAMAQTCIACHEKFRIEK